MKKIFYSLLTLSIMLSGIACSEKKEEKKHEEGRFLRREFSYTRFQQTLILPDDADTDKIEAKVKHGVLHIDIPKKAHGSEHKMNRIIAIE